MMNKIWKGRLREEKEELKWILVLKQSKLPLQPLCVAVRCVVHVVGSVAADIIRTWSEMHVNCNSCNSDLLLPCLQDPQLQLSTLHPSSGTEWPALSQTAVSSRARTHSGWEMTESFHSLQFDPPLLFLPVSALSMVTTSRSCSRASSTSVRRSVLFTGSTGVGKVSFVNILP